MKENVTNLNFEIEAESAVSVGRNRIERRISCQSHCLVAIRPVQHSEGRGRCCEIIFIVDYSIYREQFKKKIKKIKFYCKW